LNDSIWYTPEQLIQVGLERSRVVMMNEAHNGWMRCVRTRKVGKQILPTAYAAGVRYLAMEALWSGEVVEAANRTRLLPPSEQGYLSQPDMRDMIQTALDTGLTLVAYEADTGALVREKFNVDLSAGTELDDETREAIQAFTLSAEVTNWREAEQARNLIATLSAIRDDEKLLVWCGNGHLNKAMMEGGDWIPMGYQFQQLSGIQAFAIDQDVTVHFPHISDAQKQVVEPYRATWEKLGGTVGCLAKDCPAEWKGYAQFSGVEALIFSLDNLME
jgi:hypothetical protein